jgi:hypothetical protein
MPAALTHKSILLLARRRLGELHRALADKERSGARVTDLERRIGYLAGKAYQMVSVPGAQDLGGPLAADPLLQGVERFAVMGSMGPDIPAFAALLAPGQAWIFDTIHKGSPDAQREHVHAGTIDFILAFWDKVSADLAALPDATARNERLRRMRAYVLGHLAHVAGDVVSHPYVNDREWHYDPDWSPHSATESAIDAEVARQVLGRDSTRAGESWGAWWPRYDEVPAEFFAAYEEALERTYGLRSDRRLGFAEFERTFKELAPPPLDPDLLRDGYQVYRTGGIDVVYGWGWGHWFGLLAVAFVPLLAMAPLVFALPDARQLLRPPAAGDDDERGAWELLTLPVAAASLTTAVLASLMASLTTRGAETLSTWGLASAGIAVMLGTGFLTLRLTGVELPAALRWGVFSGLPGGAGLTYLSVFLRFFFDPHRQRAGAVAGVHAYPILALLVFFVCFGLMVWLWRDDDTSEGAAGTRVGSFLAVWVLGLIAAWFWASRSLRDFRIPELPEPAPSAGGHHVRLFDDAALFHLPGLVAPALADGLYPTYKRPLLKLWWTGAGKMTVRSERSRLVFRPAGSSGSADIVVPAPAAPFTLLDFVALLESAVPGVRAKVIESAPDYLLAPGPVFSDHGDPDEKAVDEGRREGFKKVKQPTEAKHDADAAEFKELGGSEEDTDYLLHHAPRTARAQRFGRLGPVAPFGPGRDALRQSEDQEGLRYVHDPVGGGEGTVMDYAADFAALLMLGGASHLLPAGEREVPGGGRAEALHQVFRNWSLDRRRVNEWRMLVAGGAASEKGARPQGADGMMPRSTPGGFVSPLFAAGTTAFAEGEESARSLGWVPLLRRWLARVGPSGADALADVAPAAGEPTNRSLSRGMAWLLDMPDPEHGPGGR